MFYSNKPSENKDYDETLIKVISGLTKKINERDDDGLIVLCGLTGTGKSRLMLHIGSIYLKEKFTINHISFTRDEFADMQYEVQQYPLPRFLAYDEANVSKRDSLSKWNKDLIDLYLANRGKNILHIWCNPTIDYLDKLFINDRVTGVIFVATKSIDRPRLYYYFTKQKLLELYEKEENLKLQTLRRNRNKYAMYCGWFKPYKGELLKEYLEKKDSRMEDKSLAFKNKYGSKVRKVDLLSLQKISDTTLISKSVLEKAKNKLVNEGLLIKDKHYFELPSGHTGYTKEATEIFKQNSFNKLKKRNKPLIASPIYNPVRQPNET